MEESIQIRVHGAPDQPVLVYLPGLHGDWTTVGGFRRALGGRVCFVEITYPRTLTWSLDDYARETAAALESRAIRHGWVVAESFGSQVLWPLLNQNRFKCDGVVLAGGFGRHPFRPGVLLAQRMGAWLPMNVFKTLVLAYARFIRWRHRSDPDVANTVREFIGRRTEPDRDAGIHRLRLIASNRPESLARQARVPVFALTGFFDIIVPWRPARRWLRAHCPAFRQHVVIGPADHNVLVVTAQRSADQVLRWMSANPGPAHSCGWEPAPRSLLAAS